MRMPRAIWRATTLFFLLLITTTTAPTISYSQPLQVSNTPTPAATPTTIPCDPATLKLMIQAVSHEWAAQGATHDALVNLNKSMFTCYFGGKNLPNCDIGTLSELQLTLSLAETAGQTPPVDQQVAYANILAACLGTTPSQLGSTPSAPGPASTPAAPPAPPGTAAAAPDCDALLADWMLHGEPGLTSASDLATFYATLLKCYAGDSYTRTCNLNALAQIHLDLRETVGKAITPDTICGYEPTLFGCLAYQPVLLAGFGGLAAGYGGAGGGSSGGGTGGGNDGGGTGGGTNDTGSALPGGPYVVKQTRSLGGETIGGQVCSLTAPFSVAVKAPAIGFAFGFVPAAADHGSWTYAYNIKKAGETHSASGTYTIAQAGKDGTLTLTMKGRDQVAFKGFSGPFPVNYSFNLVPSGNTPCKPAK